MVRQNQRGTWRPVPSSTRRVVHLTVRQAEVLQLAGCGLSAKQIARRLGISVRTVEDHFGAMRQRTGAHNQGELIAFGAVAGLVRPGPAVPEMFVTGTAGADSTRPGQPVPETSPGTACRSPGIGTMSGTMGAMTTALAHDNSVRIGYARISTRAQDYQAQLDALAAAQCREIVVETASTRGDRPRLREALARLQAGDTLVIYKPDRVARSMKELLVLLEDQLHARGINLHILTGICAGIHRPDGATIADKMMFMVAAMAAEMERDLIRERTLDGLRAAEAQGRRGGRPPAIDEDLLAAARARQGRGESVTAIARHLKVGRSTLYRALQPVGDPAVTSAAGPARLGHLVNAARMTRQHWHAQRGRPGGGASPAAGRGLSNNGTASGDSGLKCESDHT
jgi:DNA invertase Pin-like site-specific DNA recombinase/DNA-binding CsgD family transcriptional regulator